MDQTEELAAVKAELAALKAAQPPSNKVRLDKNGKSLKIGDMVWLDGRIAEVHHTKAGDMVTFECRGFDVPRIDFHVSAADLVKVE